MRHFFAGAAGLSAEGSGAGARLVEALDGRRFAQILDQFGLRLVGDEILDLAVHFVEGRRRLGALILDLDDVPAELRMDRIGNLSLVELERGFGEFGHHLVLGEVAEIAAIGRARVFGFFLGERGEVRALLQLGFDLVRFCFGRHQDMTRVHLFLGRHLLDRLVIDLVHRVVGQGGLAGILQQRFHQHLVALEVEMVLDVVTIADLLLVGGLRQDDDVGEISDEVFAFLIGRHLRHAGADLILGQREIALADIDAVDAGDERIGILRLDDGWCDEERGERECAERAGERAGGSHKHESFGEAVLRRVVVGFIGRISLRSGVGRTLAEIAWPWQWQNPG